MTLPILFQRIEGATICAAAVYVYFQQELPVVLFILLLFAFDVFMAGYCINRQVGAITYNIGHSFIIPSLLIIPYLFTDSRVLLGLMCLWFAHIGLDRALGYGLKLSDGFAHTHLGFIGKNKQPK